MTTRTAIRTGVVACIAALAACAPEARVTHLYESPAPGSGPYDSIFVVVVTSDDELRRDFEHRLAGGLERAGVAAVPSHRVLAGPSDGMRQGDLDRAAADAGSGAILESHIAGVDSRYELEEGRSDLRTECRGGNPVDVFLYDHEVLKEPDSVREAHTVVVVSNLYDTAGRGRVWTIQSTCVDQASMYEAIAVESDAIVRQLEIDRLIR